MEQYIGNCMGGPLDGKRLANAKPVMEHLVPYDEEIWVSDGWYLHDDFGQWVWLEARFRL